MRPVEVIESKRWRNGATGATASIYGALPWTVEADKANWSCEVVGYTVRMSNGTVGCGRRPWATREEAEAFLIKWGSR